MATVPPTRLALGPLTPRLSPATSALLARVARYSVLVSIVHPMAGIGLGIATLRGGTDAAGRRQARIGIAVGVLAYVAYTAAVLAMARICFDLLARLVALSL